MHIVATRDGIGLLEGESVALLETPYNSLDELFAAGEALDVLADAPVRRRALLDDLTQVSAVSRPRALWGVGLNYRSKAERAGRDLPQRPILFLPAPSAITDPGTPVDHPRAQVAEMDAEAEIAVVVGRRLYQADPDECWAGVAGFVAANDMTARDVMRDTAIPALAKSFPGFKPLGSSLCTLDEFEDPRAVPVRSWCNGELRQDDTSAGMIFPVDDLLSRISQYAVLEPGDLVVTGTPAGTGQDHGEFLGDGDEIRIEIGPLLPLANTFRGSAG